jgi:short-subunit dehydrogenase
MIEITGKKVVLTGAASGIGRALALQLAEQGACLYLLDRNKDELIALAEILAQQFEADIRYRICDLANPTDITSSNQGILRDWGGIDILINNAGICYYGPTVHMTARQWQQLSAVNFNAPIQMMHQWLPVLMRRPQGQIVNVASMFGLLVTRRCTMYHATKFGLVGFSEALRAETGNQIYISTICPGLVRTVFFDSAFNGYVAKATPNPPTWISTTPEHTARVIVRAMQKNKRLVVVTWFGKLLYYTQRFAPWRTAFLQWLGRKKGRKVFAADDRGTLNDIDGYQKMSTGS